GAPSHLLIAGLVLAVILLLSRYTRGLLNNAAVLIGIVVGCAAAVATGQMTFEHVAAAPWFGWVRPFQFGLPRFELAPILT
ncbi:solute carrier family 23 protein, partial [Rhizobium leguminosarum]|uniref:solute carrier family 23 protein n=1 Tax=Rhizobium leguminosarum TaxID=384 RepID=UPI003F9610D1